MPARFALRAAVALLVCAGATPARAEPQLLEGLRVASTSGTPPLSRLALSAEPSPPAGSLDFDLLGEPEQPPPTTDLRGMRLRSRMLKTHQVVGLGLVGLQLATTAVGQLNYSDRFAGGPSTGRYQLGHKVLAYTTLVVFAGDGALALFAPTPPGKTSAGFDRVKLHKLAMFTAAAGMLTQGVLGIYTSSREGYQNHERIATIHLAVGYATLAAMLTGVGALVL